MTERLEAVRRPAQEDIRVHRARDSRERIGVAGRHDLVAMHYAHAQRGIVDEER